MNSEDITGTYSPNTRFSIELSYGNFLKWQVHRRVLDFVRLHSILTFRHLNGKLGVKIPSFPNQLSYIVDMSSLFRNLSKDQRHEIRSKISLERRKALERYLNELLFIINMESNVTEVFEFLELSTLSISRPEASGKLKEGYLRNRLFDARPKSCCLWFIPQRKRFMTQWFIIRSSYIVYVDSIDQSSPSEVILCDPYFKVEFFNQDYQSLLKPFTALIKNGTKKLEVRCESNLQMQYWMKDLQTLAKDNVWCQIHRFNSFAPIRNGCKMDWLTDSKDYFEMVAKAISNAQHEVYIHGWWVSPELYLKRPPSKFPELRLDRLLQKKAMEGVRVFVIIFKEVTLALPINSYHTKVSLERLHPNISVQRHPDHLGGILLWAHHDKLVVVDQKVAFIGGIDLCYGRYDNCEHSLVDYNPDSEEDVIWSGLDYSNPRIKDFRNVTQYSQPLVDRRIVPRMPWHDVQAVVYGQPARDAARHFIQRWNYIKSQKSMHREGQVPFLLPKEDFTESDVKKLGYAGTSNIQLLRSSAEWSSGMLPEVSIYDAYVQAIERSEYFIYIENQFFVSKCADAQVTPVRNRIATAICSRIARAYAERKTFRVIVVLPLLPAFESAVNRSEASCIRVIMQGQYSAISRGPNSIIGSLIGLGIKPEDYISFFALRTYDRLDGQYVTEQVYVHSKVLIVDDRLAIVGSANINDRSMVGVRDSELALQIEDDVKEDASFNGVKCKISPKVRELRVKLFKEHLGLLNHDVSDPLVKQLDDPVSDAFYHQQLRFTASLNTQIYRELFHCVPDDCADSWDEYKRFTEKPSVQSVDPNIIGIDMMENIKQIRGHIVMFPLNFLKREDLSASMLTPEYLLPVETYL